MSTIHFHYTTISTPSSLSLGPPLLAGVLEALSNSAREHLKVDHRGPSEVDVTEGSGGIWERLHDDWSDSDRVA